VLQQGAAASRYSPSPCGSPRALAGRTVTEIDSQGGIRVAGTLSHASESESLIDTRPGGSLAAW
jgi:hypothetical protein